MTDEKQQEKDPCVDYVVQEFEKYEAHHSDTFAKARTIIAHWNGDPPEREEEHMNAVCVPAILEAEQTITPRLFTSLFPNDAPVDIKAEGDTPAADAVTIKSLVQHFFRVASVREKAHPLLSQTTLLGTGYADAGSWRTRRGYVTNDAGERRYKIVSNRPDFETIDFFEIFPHPRKLTVGDEFPVIRRRYVDEEALKTMANIPHFVFENLIEALKTEAPVKGEGGKKEYQDEKRKQYEVLEYWGPYDKRYIKTDEKGEQREFEAKAVPHWIIIVNRKVVVRKIENPYNHQRAPYIKPMFMPPVSPSWFGVGVGQMGLPAQERLNKLVNQRLDNVDLILNKICLFNGLDTLLNPKQLGVSRPGKRIKCSDVTTSVKWMDTPDVTASSYKEEESAKRDFRESVGAVAPLMPAEDKNEQHRTAMGIQLLQGAAGIRFKPVLLSLEASVITETATFFFENCKQFMSVPEWVEIMGEGASKMIEVRPEEIRRRVRFVPTGISETLNKEIQMGQLLRFKEITQNDPTINRAEINKRIGELFGFKDLDKLVVPSQAPQQAPQGQGGLSPEQQAMVRQRIAEGANPDQIKQEMLGPRPQEQVA